MVYKPLLFFLLATISIYFVLSISPADEFQEVRLAYRELLEEASVTAETPPLERLFKAKRVSSRFDEEVRGEIVTTDSMDEGHVLKSIKISRKRIEQRLVAAYRISREIRPEILSDSYSRAEDGKGVQLKSVLRVYGDKPGDGVMFLEELKLAASFTNENGEWLITEATIERVSR